MLNINELKMHLQLDTNTFTFRWVSGTRSRPKGKKAGTVIKPHGASSKSRYRVIRFKKKCILEHRLVWMWFNGPIPDGYHIDHIDHNGLNNHIDNLRVVSACENSLNMPRRSDNTSGVTGVWFHNQIKKWAGEIYKDGKKYSLGCFDRKRDAIAARRKAERELGFHENHGLAKI